MKSEICFCCGEKSPVPLPMIGVVSDGKGGWKHELICHSCWSDPSHRTTPIKAHFFMRSQEKIALALAGSSSLG